MSEKTNNANNFLSPTNSPKIAVPKILQELKSSDMNSSLGTGGGVGSATGNPRNKCALKPGHSLMDWIRLGNSGEDLSGTKGRIIPVTLEELAKHNRRDDAWMAIRGVVYNVTRYMDFHPGGADELMRGIGRDATKLFNEVHAWVNYQQLLNKCRIGPLKNSIKLDSALEESLTKKSSTQNVFIKPPMPPQDITPRLDWIQNRNSITIYFYTKQFCNPGTIIRKMDTDSNSNCMEIWILIDLHLHKYEFEFRRSLKWPPKDFRIASESGKIEVIFNKSEEENINSLWPDLGKHNVSKILRNSLEDEIHFDYKIISNEIYNHNSFELILKNDFLLYQLPLGYHVSLKGLVNSKTLSKSYTPIPEKYITKSLRSDKQTLTFLIKKYNHGNSFSSMLANLTPDKLLEVSIPKGNFKLSDLTKHRCICFLVAGSGLTPILSLIDHLLKRNTNRIELLKLFYFNKTSKDIWCLDVLKDIAEKDERFEFINILSQPEDNWNGIKGHISVDLLKPILEKSSIAKVTYIGACGPLGFNQKLEEILMELQFPKENLFIF